MKSKHIKGKLILLLASIVWGFAFVAQDVAANYVDPFTLNTIRCLIATIFLLPLLFITSKKEKKDNIKYSKKNMIKAGILCGFFLFIGMNLQQFGIQLYPDDTASSGRSGFITALYVVLVPIISVFLKKKLKISSIISVLIALIGMYLLCFSKGFSHFYIGDLLVLLSALGYALQIITIDKYSSELNIIKFSVFEFIVCSILSSFVMFIVEKPDINDIFKAIVPLLYLGIVSSALGYTFQILGQKLSNNPTIDSIIMSLESVFALIGGVLILHEKLLLTEIIGCALMFIAIIISQIFENINFKKKTNKN